MTLTLSIVQRMLDAAVAEATARGARLSFCVVDAGGYEIATVRMDGAPLFTPGIARAKAQTSALLRRDSGEAGAMMTAHPGLTEAIAPHIAFELTTLTGGAVIASGDVVLGGIGGSGAQPEVDLACAKAGLAAVRL